MSWRKLRGFLLPISIALFALGVYLTITGGYWVLHASEFIGKNEYFDYLTQWAGAWNWWFLILGVILLLAGGWYAVDNIRKRRKFEEYIESDSKKKFVQNLRELEEIAYKLGPKYEERLAEKKREWRVKH